ncbi:Ubiquinone/menaquinone biosynthesis C-methyltransferase UbiE [Paludisphaera borealis]|uniref:Ubiquinone/menaquinone biosynthesis C-methyltransferase UbiE n=2 Tax=Paludisphaera borealis TaxID=1387353 RepID=A0A1U7CIC7_9BACT|nr:Ubiquinone/menaquinone biosynthesis C-methyltransferase UbiE [Paludisphaera borealis]
MMGCQKPTESAAPFVESKQVAEQGLEQEGANMHGEHGHHHGGFDDPKLFETRWNDPDRDKWQHPEEIVAALALTPGATVADIGAGTGYMVAHLSEAVGERGTVIPIDVEQAMITYLTRRGEELGPAKIVPHKARGDSPELHDDSVDGVITLNTWHHIKGREAYAKKVYAGLKRGGRFVVVDSEVDAESGPPKEMRLAAGRVVKELETAGFRAEIARESMPQHYMIVGYKD